MATIKKITLEDLGLMIQKMDKKIDTLDKRIDTLDTKIDTLDTKFESKFDDLYEIVTFIKDNAVMRDEFEERFFHMDTRMGVLTSMMDRMIKQHDTFIVELHASKHRGNRHEDRIERVENHLGLAAL